jgi:hypothetical protein
MPRGRTDFKEEYCEKYRFLYPRAKNPKEGLPGIIK